MAKSVRTFIFAIILCSLNAANLWAQYSIQHQPPIIFERSNTNHLEFTVTGLPQSEVQEGILYYRYDGGFSYQQKETEFRNGVFSTQFDVQDQNASSIEYYLEIMLRSGKIISYPLNSPSENPVQVQIVEEQEEKQKNKLENIEFTILSPRPGSGVKADDAVIAMALFYDPDDLPKGQFQLLLDGKDVTTDADISTYYISFIPNNLNPGYHTITLNYATADENFLVMEWDFYVVQKGETSASYTAVNLPSGQIELTARNQVIAGDVNNAYTGRTRLSGSYKGYRYALNGYFTTQESDRLQPQNRFSLRLQKDDWLQFEAGHVYPYMSNLTISGRRVFGVNTSLQAFNNNLNVQFIHGELDRAIENRYGSINIEPIIINGLPVDSLYILNYENGGRGTFKRKITGGRIGFGNVEKFQFGIHVMKVKDDTTSLNNVRNYDDLLFKQSPLLSLLNPEDHLNLQENPNKLEIQGGSLKPRDNIVAGTDLKFGFDNNRIRFESEAVVSSLNNDIYGGPLTIEHADDLGFDINKETADMLDKLSWLIVINENMNSLPFRLYNNENGNSTTEFFFPTSILAGNSELSIRYPSNNFRLQYRWIGPNFNSLANTTIRKDIAGFTVSDRFSLFSNRFYVTLGIENLQDNVVGHREATTNTNTYRTNVSWFPISEELPRVNVGLRYRTRNNDIVRFNPEAAQYGFEHAAVQNLQIANGDTLITSFPRKNNTININASISQQFRMEDMFHDVSLNFSNMKTNDEVFAYGDVSNSTISLNVTSRFTALPLNTQLGLNINKTESGSGQHAIDIFGIYMGGNYFMLDDKVNVHTRIAFTRNKISSRNLEIETQNDSNRLNDFYYLSDQTDYSTFSTFALQAGAQYNFNKSHVLIFEASMTNISVMNRENDHVAQLRYIFRF